MKKAFLFLSVLTFFGCEDEVSVNLKDSPASYVVDAWINNQVEEQIIELTWTQAYFDNSPYTPVSGASVVVTDDDGNELLFQENNPGEYVWDPLTSLIKIETIGTQYELRIEVDGEVFVSTAMLNRVPLVDSIKFTFKEEQNAFQPEGYYGEFVATDFVGSGDTYWIKAFKNGISLNNPFDLNIAFDAGFNEGGNIDGVVFIQPIQDAVTPLNEELDEIVPYVIGDSLYVEIHSISNDAFDFLQQVQIQTQRDGGFDEIFAEPLENVSTNIIKQNATSNAQVIGFFNVSAVSARGRRLID